MYTRTKNRKKLVSLVVHKLTFIKYMCIVRVR